MNLQEIFFELLANYTQDEHLIKHSWNEIVEAHSHSCRFYHNLDHLENIYSQLSKVKSSIQHWDAILFTLFYHDFVYDVQSKQNEVNSSIYAGQKMYQFGLPQSIIQIMQRQIEATQSHQDIGDNDTQFFLDADLSVLGLDWNTYNQYSENVRKEYAIYTDEMYREGRKKVLAYFLNMDRVFKTSFFFDAFEMQAHTNLQRELQSL